MRDALQRVRSILAKVTYKPGWNFRVTADPNWNILSLICTWQVPSINSPNETIALSFMRTFDYQMIDSLSDDAVVDLCIGYTVRSAELHEMDEWLKFNGQCVREPHPELQTHSS